MDANRLRGVNLVEPLGLRLARGARLSAIVTGLNREQQGSSTLVPPAPQEVARRVAAEVLGTTGAGRRPLVGHGPAAVRRRYARALAWPLVLTAALVVGVLVADVPPGWIALGAGRRTRLGRRSATTGPAGSATPLLPGHLVARSGSLMRRRVILETPAVIGWTFTSTWFQRRVGLTTVVATMAGGRQSVTILDVPEADWVRRWRATAYRGWSSSSWRAGQRPSALRTSTSESAGSVTALASLDTTGRNAKVPA